MADRKATNKYYPPEWTPDKGSINKFRGSHPLRDRARKLDQGIMIIRFELPFNVWCGGCGEHLGMGVRYNAEKTQVGKYYTTPIFKFRMKCHLCDSHFEIQTDPQNFDYVVVSGASRKNERWEHTEGETMAVEGKSEAEKLASDPMYRLEHNVEDKKKSDESAPRISKILEMHEDRLDDFTLNQKLRKTFRVEKHRLREKALEEEKLQKKASISIPLVDEHDDDVKTAQKTAFSVKSSAGDKRRKRMEIQSQSVFGEPSSTKKAKLSAQSHSILSGDSRSKQAKLALLKACSSSSGTGRARSNSEGGGASVKGLRNSLGIRTKT